MSQHLGRIEISTQLLEGWMSLPEGSTIRRVSDANTERSLFFEIIVEHPDLPEVDEFDEIPLVGYTVTRTVTREVVQGEFRL